MTVNVAEPDIPLNVAVIVIVPAARPVAVPLEPAALLIDATGDDAGWVCHVTDAVRFCVLPSENVPVAVNCCVLLTIMLVFAGVTAMDTSVAGVTVRVAEADTPYNAAVIVAVPEATEDANP